MVRVLQTVAKHSVKADVADPDEAYDSKLHVWGENSKSTEPYWQHVTVHQVVNQTGCSVSSFNEQEQAEIGNEEQAGKECPMMWKEPVVRRARRAQGKECLGVQKRHGSDKRLYSHQSDRRIKPCSP